MATGSSGLFDQWGERMTDFALGDLFGAHSEDIGNNFSRNSYMRNLTNTLHTYLRLTPELRRQTWGPHVTDEPVVNGARHPIMDGFDETDILPFGGLLEQLKIDSTAEVLMTFIPEFPIYPPETAWMRTPKTGIPGLVIRKLPGGSRVIFMPADIDRQFARYNLPDHGNLLSNLFKWGINDQSDLKIDGPGLIDCQLYRQEERLVLHLVNLTSVATWRQPLDELIPVGPFDIALKLPVNSKTSKIRFLVNQILADPSTKNGWCHFRVDSISDHEVVVIYLA